MKRILCLLTAMFMIICALSIPAFADSATIAVSKSNVTVGSNVTVTVRYNASFAMYGIDASLTYNSSVLQYVSGGTNQGSTVKYVETLSGETSKSFSVTFKAIAAGSGSLSVSAKASGTGDGSASAGTAINVTALQPSSNTNLGSIKLSEGTLSPSFKSSTTSYSAKVKYGTEKISISANAAAGDSTVSGLGTFDLKVGDNSFNLTVAAPSGNKKTYTVVVKRMTEEETAAALQEERDNNPSLIVIDGVDYFLQSDLSGLGTIDGYTLSSVQRKGSDISVLSDNGGKYKLFWAVDASGQNGTFYIADANDNFTRVNYIKLNERLYIIEPFDFNISVDPRFSPGEYDMNGTAVSCYKYSDEELSDFYLFNCYFNGENGYYRFDAAQNTMQREPQFLAKEVEAVSEPESGILDKFNQLSTQAKVVLGLLSFAAVLVVVLIVLLIIRAVGKNKKPDFEDENIDLDSLFSSETEGTNSNYEETVETQTIQEETVSIDGSQADIQNSDDSEFLDSINDF